MNLKKKLYGWGSWGLLCFVLGLAPSVAVAGVGASYGSLRNAIATNNPDTIMAQLERAEKLPCRACIELVMPLIDDRRIEVRDVAAWWLAKRAIRTELRDAMIGRLISGGTISARNAAEVLGRFMHPDALEALEFALLDEELGDAARVAAATAIATIGHGSGKEILEAGLNARSVAVRVAAATSLRGIRGNSDGLALIPLLGDDDPRVVSAASLSLGALEEWRAVPELIGVADSDGFSARARMNACWALGQIGDTSAMEVLKNISQDDPDTLVRSAARTGYFKLLGR